MAIQTQLYPSNAGPGFSIPLCGSQDLMIDNQSCFNFQHNPQQQQQFVSTLRHDRQVPVEERRLQQQQLLYNNNNNKQRNQNMSLIDPTLLSNSNAFNINHPSTLNSQSLALLFHTQWGEVDQFIRLQNEKLRIMLQGQRQQQVTELLKNMELDALYVLSQKDEQIEQAARKKAELEEFLTRLEAENESWRREAQEKEAMVLSLHNTLERMKERGGVVMDDAGSYCDEGRRNMAMEEEGTGENRVCGDGVGDAEQNNINMMVCNNCNSRSSCFMFLPCRHLCSCKACEAFLQACPVCRMPKKSSIEALIF